MSFQMLEKTLAFLREIAENNHREWFNTHKNNYLAAKSEFDALVERLIPLVQKMDPEVGSISLSDCTYRIYRDTRFSPDKTPYKTHFGAYFNKKGKKSPYAGYYLHISPVEGSLWAGGVYCPDPRILKAIRQDIYDNIDEFRGIIEHPSLAKDFKFFEANKLKKAPTGFPADWPYIELLKNRTFDVFRPIDDKTIASSAFVEETISAFRAIQPLNRFFNYTIEHALETGRSFARSITSKA